MINDNQRERSCNHLTKSESLKFIVLLKHMDKRTSSMYKFLAFFMFICCIGMAIYILACEYKKLAQINVQLRAILLQSENLNNQE